MNLAQTETALAGVRFLSGLSRRQLLALVAANVLQGAGADLTAAGLKTAVGDSKFLVGAGEDAILALAVSAFITANGGVLESRSDVNAALHDARFLLGLPGAELAAVAAAAYFGSPGGGGGSGFAPWTWSPDSVSAEGFWGQMGFSAQQSGALPDLTDLTFNGAALREGITISGSSLLTFSAPNLASMTEGAGLTFYGNASITSISFPALVEAGSVYIASSPLLTSLDLSALQTCILGYIQINDNYALTSLDLSSLETCSGFNLKFNNLLTSLDVSSVIQIGPVDCSGSALDEASVNGFLARLVVSTTDGSTPWNGSADFSGGTNAAPSGQGIADKATLIGRGATVTTN